MAVIRYEYGEHPPLNGIARYGGRLLDESQRPHHGNGNRPSQPRGRSNGGKQTKPRAT